MNALSEPTSSWRVGTRVYGLAAVGLGVTGIAWDKFAEPWQPIQSLGEVPHVPLLAYLFAACFLTGGMLIQFSRTARIGVAFVSCLHAISAALWLPRVIGFPRIYGTWGGLAQQLSMVAAGVMAYSMLSGRTSSLPPFAIQLARIV